MPGKGFSSLLTELKIAVRYAGPICWKKITQTRNFHFPAAPQNESRSLEAPRRAFLTPAFLFNLARFSLREKIPLAQLDQNPLLHHMPQDQGALLGLDVKKVHNVLPVGEARLGKVL